MLSSFEETFGKKSRRTLTNLSVYKIEELASRSQKQTEEYLIEKDSNLNEIYESRTI